MRGRAEAARRAHNPEVGGSNPPPATKTKTSRTIVLHFFMQSCSESLLSAVWLRKKKRQNAARFGIGKALHKKDRDEVAILYPNKKTDDLVIRFSYVETVHAPSLPV